MRKNKALQVLQGIILVIISVIVTIIRKAERLLIQAGR